MLSAQFVSLNLTGPLFQLKMSHAAMSSDTCRVAGEIPAEPDQFFPYRTSEGRCWICVGHWWNGDRLGNFPLSHSVNHKFHEGSWYLLVLFLRDSSNSLSFCLVCKVLPASKFHTMMVCVVSAAVKIRTYWCIHYRRTWPHPVRHSSVSCCRPRRLLRW